MRILIAGKQAALRSALKILLQTRPGLELVASAENIEELFSMFKATRPELLLLDEDLNKAILDTVLVPMQALDPNLLIIVLGQRSELKETYLEAGAVTYLTKDDPPKSLLTALEEARLQKKHG